jgi:hypothetical protein
MRHDVRKTVALTYSLAVCTLKEAQLDHEFQWHHTDERTHWAQSNCKRASVGITSEIDWKTFWSKQG